jgi:hypothetical protein
VSPEDQQKQKELEQSQRVMLLLEDLIDRERHTLDAIMRALFEIGSINFVNQKVRFRLLRPVVRPVVKLSKPVLTHMGYRWFRQKGPRLIVNWLMRKIRFAPPPSPAKTTPSQPLVNASAYQGEIRRLRSQVRITTGALVSVSGILIALLHGFDPRILMNSSSNIPEPFDPAVEPAVGSDVAQRFQNPRLDKATITGSPVGNHPTQN